jgi:hypothetical protein
MFKKYQRTNLAEMRELEENETKTILKQKGVSISEPDMELSEYDFSLGKIARNPENRADQWYVAKDYFDKNFVPVEAIVRQGAVQPMQTAGQLEHDLEWYIPEGYVIVEEPSLLKVYDNNEEEIEDELYLQTLLRKK